ncbi:MAG: GAF domain-containing protein [Deltaproteobacteria bacterium]|nr:GAF domain-containing protein [Deltaproteobacteria bacterium]
MKTRKRISKKAEERYRRDATEHKQGEEAPRESEETAGRLSQENAVMAEIGRIISSTLNIEEIYERFSEEVQKLIPFDRIVINIINIEKATVMNVYMAGKGIAGRKIGEIYPLEGSGNAEMVRTKSSILIQTEDFNEYKDHFPMLLSTFQAGFRSIMDVPLFSKGQLIGGLLLRSFKPYVYTDKDVRLAERVSSQIAGAIANAQLFIERKRAEEALEKSVEELRAFNEELRATEEELRASNEELQAVNEDLKEAQEQLIRSEKLAAIGKLAGGVGHELRNPLGAIKNAVYYIRGKLINSELAKTEPRIIEFLDIVDDEISCSNKIITDLLNFSRVGKLAVSPAKIRKVMEAALSYLTVPENIEVINTLDANLPEVEIDADQIRQVLVNIATNAIQAMSERGKLTIDARRVDKFLEVTISDTGDGISEDVIGKIFDPLFTTRAKGIGLGLAVCKSIIERHGGAIEVESKVGEGATFTVRLPLKAN